MNELKTESEFKIIGVWGKRHERILKVEHKALYQSLLLAGKLIPFEKEAVHTLSYDEKSGIQAIATTGEDRPPIPNTDKSSGYQRDEA